MAETASDIRETIAELKGAGTTAARFFCHLQQENKWASRFRLYEYLLGVCIGAGFLVLCLDYSFKRLLQTVYCQRDFVSAE